MKYLRLFLLGLLLVFIVQAIDAIELDEGVYKFNGKYSVIEADGIRVYYPKAAAESITRILHGLKTVRNNLVKSFPSQDKYHATVLLTDNDDRITSSSDPDRDWITIGMFEEMDSLSTRGYSLQKRFALRLSKIYLLRTLGKASNIFKRKLAIYALPQWFLDGLAQYYAFPLDSVHYSRLLDMARNNSLHSLNSLDTMLSQSTLNREEMSFQAHNMIAMWETKYKKGAGLQVLESIIRRPTQFRAMFKKYYGKSLHEAFNEYTTWICDECAEVKKCKDNMPKEFVEEGIGGKFFKSLRYIGEDEKVWVSSKRYFTESYDLYYQKGERRPRILVKNVHPSIFVDEANKTVYLGKYWVTGMRQRRLGIWSANFSGKTHKKVDEAGSFKPLGKKFGRIFYVSIKSGVTSIKSFDPEFNSNTREEFVFPVNIRPLDMALDKSCQKLYFTSVKGSGNVRLSVISIARDDNDNKPMKLYENNESIGSLNICNDKVWFTAQDAFSTTQLFSISTKENKLNKYSQLPGGVWDFSIENDLATVITLNKGEFWATKLLTDKAITTEFLEEPQKLDTLVLNKVRGQDYKKEYKNKYWKPVFGRDQDGSVFGFYSHRTDRLDRSNITVAPTYGYKSQHWGYEASYMQRLGLLKATLSINDKIRRKHYLSNKYYERDREKILDFNYPFNLSTSISFGANLNKRGIAEIPDNGAPFPSVGRDHSFYAEISHRAIRTEPYWKVFPRKGRTVTASYQKGTHLLDGELIYDTMSIKWDEYIPIKNGWVVTLCGYVAEEDKENNLRKPDDLSLGGNEYMRAYDGAFRSGDSLRTMSLHLGRPINFQFPRFMGWIRNEFLAGEVFWEAGDVKVDRRFAYVFDRGAEIRMQALLFKRIPIIFRIGHALQNGGNDSKSYFTVDVSKITGFID